MSDYSNRRVLVYDSGLNVGLANALTRYFGEVIYFTTWSRAFPSMTEVVSGHGYDGVRRATDFWNHVNDVDLFVFPDCYNGDVQVYLDSIGKRVWGSRKGANLELCRWNTKDLMKSVGLPLNPCERVRGLNELRSLLKKKTNCFVKISSWRGDMESWHHINYELSEPRLDELAFRLGPVQHMAYFIVEDAIETEIEVGYDGIFTGSWPNFAMQGYEKKDCGLLASVMPYEELPEEVREVNEKLEPFLRENKYRNFLSTEIRIGEDSLPYLIDVTSRTPIPSSSIQIANYKNLPDILWHGAAGESVPIEYRAKFGAEAMIYSEWAHKHWMTVKVDEDVQPYVNLFNSVNLGKEIEAVIPSFQDLAVIGNEVGSVIGLGDTLEEAIEECREHAKGIEGMGIETKVDAFESLLPQIEEAQKKGIKFSDEPIPQSV
jgi:hypothetical protein